MSRTTTVALAAATALTLTACGGNEPLTQEQSASVLLTEEEFGVDGWTRGEVQDASDDDTDQSTAGAEDTVEDAFEGLGIPQACQDALTSIQDGQFGSLPVGSSVSFTGEQGGLVAEEAQLVVGTVEGANPLQGLGAVNQECADLEIEQGPAAVTMSFQAVEGLDGTKMTMTLLDEAIEMLLVGRQDGDTVVALTATGLEEDQARRIVERQLEKLTDL